MFKKYKSAELVKPGGLDLKDRLVGEIGRAHV